MPRVKCVWLVVGLAAVSSPFLGRAAFGQGAVAFDPIIGAAPNGETMTVTPAVSADRRYVRLSVNAFFNTVNGFSAFTTPLGAVSGSGGNGGGGLGGGGVGGGLGGLGGGLGGVGGLRSVGGFGAGGETFNAGMNGVIGPAGFDGSMGFEPSVYVGQFGEMRAGALPPSYAGLRYGFDDAAAPRRPRLSDTRPRADQARPTPTAAPAEDGSGTPTLETARSEANAPPPAVIPKALSRHEKARSARAARRKKVSDEEPVIKPKDTSEPPRPE